MSGTSADGIDAALVCIQPKPLVIKLERFLLFGHPPELKNRILRACSPIAPLTDLGELHVLLGRLFGDAALHLVQKAKFPIDKIDFIGSHGQTVFHQPPSRLKGEGIPFTLQLGDGSVIAEVTGIPTVSDFRAADMAAGGEGAPLVPYFDWRLFTHPKKNRVLLNIGGIANFTFLPAKADLHHVTATDTGPGNVLLDSLIRRFTHGEHEYDEEGALAARGTIREDLLGELFSLPFIQRTLPKSADREEFGESLAEQIVRAYPGLSSADVLATATAFTAESVLRHVQTCASRVDELYVSGGGANNKTLMAFLKLRFDKIYNRNVLFYPFDRLGIPAKAKEAVAFAFLAYQTLSGVPSNVPNVTGAKKECVLGKISQGWRKPWTIV